MDVDGTGTIDFKELNDFIHLIAKPIGMEEMSKDEVQKLIDDMDMSDTHTLTLDEI